MNESREQEVEKLKAAGKHEEAGAHAFKTKQARYYGAHYGMRSTKHSDQRAFFKGYDDAKSEHKKVNEDHVWDIVLEVLTKKSDAGKWVHDFVHSDNPKFESKSKKKRIKMALAAYYSKQNEETLEETKAFKTDVPDISHSGTFHKQVMQKVKDGQPHTKLIKNRQSVSNKNTKRKPSMPTFSWDKKD